MNLVREAPWAVPDGRIRRGFSVGLFLLLTNIEALFMIANDRQEGRADSGALGLVLIAVGLLGLGWADRGR